MTTVKIVTPNPGRYVIPEPADPKTCRHVIGVWRSPWEDMRDELAGPGGMPVDWPDLERIDADERFAFCPHCGARIEVIEEPPTQG